MKRERSDSSSGDDSKLPVSDTEFKPSVTPSPPPSPSKKRRVKTESKGKAKTGSGGGRPWTGEEYASLFKLVCEVGRKEAFLTFPGRTRNQAYQAWR